MGESPEDEYDENSSDMESLEEDKPDMESLEEDKPDDKPETIDIEMYDINNEECEDCENQEKWLEMEKMKFPYCSKCGNNCKRCKAAAELADEERKAAAIIRRYESSDEDDDILQQSLYKVL